jgi:hypothetical protein
MPRLCFPPPDVRDRAERARPIALASGIGFAATGHDYPPSYRDNDRLVHDDPALATLRKILPDFHSPLRRCLRDRATTSVEEFA